LQEVHRSRQGEEMKKWKYAPPKKGFKYGKTNTGQRFKYWVVGKMVYVHFIIEADRKEKV
jgi:hypothetical protein